MSDNSTKKFVSFVNNNYGLDLSSNINFAKQHLSSDIIRTRSVSYDNYIANIKNDKDAENDMLSKILTNHTYFFRDDFHFEHTKKVIIPSVLEKYHDATIHIWCCAVSTGQEAYSLAMTLDYFMPDVNFSILASDLSQNAVMTAKKGIYPMSTLEQIPQIYQKRYCTDNNDGTFSISEKLKKYINFKVINLADKVVFQNRFDAVYCRNVLMYFSGNIKEQVLFKVAKSLKRNGFLYIGSSENISTLSNLPFDYVNSSVYKKSL